MSKHKSLFGLVATVAVCMSVILSPVTARADSPGTGLSLSITSDVLTASLGENISYAYVISSTSNNTIDSLVLTDDRLGTISLPTTSIAPGENITAVAVHKVAVADFPGPLSGSATVTGASATDNYTATEASSVALNAPSASLKVDLTASKHTATPGDNVTYSYTVVNTGQSNLTGIVLTDSRLGAIILPSSNLAPLASVKATALYTVLASDLPGPLVDNATVHAVGVLGQTLTAGSKTVSIRLMAGKGGEDDDEIGNDDDDNGNDDGGGDSHLTKGEIHGERGVPGKGIDHAPGQQKYFNDNRGGEDHGKKGSVNSVAKENGNGNGKKGQGNGKQNGNQNHNNNEEDD